MNHHNKSIVPFLFLLFGILAAGCSQPFNIVQALPGADAVAGWQATGEPQLYDKNTIFQLMDGQAEFFFRYGFENVAVRSYQNSQGNNLDVEVWQLATTADAYGLFTANDNNAPVLLGKANEANISEGSRLVFWQNRYFVLVRPAAPVPNTELLAFGEVISNILPTGGVPPDIMKKLPADGKVERSEIFFHEEMTIQNEVWLGGEDILGLSQQTDGALAQYAMGDAKMHLMLIDFPDAEAASSAMAALKEKGAEDLLAARSEGATLGAVFGKADPVVGEALLAKGLANR
jgi:hypothetical protein